MHQHSKNPKNIASSLGCASMRQSGLAKMVGFGAILAVLSLNQSLHAAVIGKWLFDEGTGLTATDQSGHSLNGTVSNTALWTSDHPTGATHDYAGNHALSFDQNNPQQVTVGSSSLLNAAALSFQFWYKDSRLAGGGDSSTYSYIAGRTDAWVIERVWRSATDISLRLYLKRSDATGSWFSTTYSIIQSVSLSQDELWHNIAFTCTDNGNFTVYFDGSVYTNTQNNISLAKTSTSDITFGKFSANNTRRCTFEMDEFAIYDEALTAAQVLANIPEPASLALLLAGGLLVLRRKRG
ncbi:MAG: LamG-like jellyroll fold domain-containing protein [Lentisphaeria bacterium]